MSKQFFGEEGTGYDFGKPDFTEATVKPIGNKLLRGLGNAVFGIAEVPGQIAKGAKLKAPDFGIIKGFWYWIGREIDGIYDICTFPLPNPTDTKALSFDEKWAWSALGDNMKK